MAQGGEPIEALLDRPVDVRCPRCSHRAAVSAASPGDTRWLGTTHRLVCPSCALVREVDGGTVTIHDDGFDPWFGQELWWRALTADGTLWAYHRDHLDALRTWIAATDRPAAARAGWRSMLPAWITSAHCRDDLLRVIDALIARGGPRD